MKSFSYEYDVVVNGEHLHINPKDLPTAREIARSWNGEIVRRKVEPYEPLPAHQKDKQEFYLKIGDLNDDFNSVVVVTAGGVDGQEVDSWEVPFLSALPSIRKHGYILASAVGNHTYIVFK